MFYFINRSIFFAGAFVEKSLSERQSFKTISWYTAVLSEKNTFQIELASLHFDLEGLFKIVWLIVKMTGMGDGYFKCFVFKSTFLQKEFHQDPFLLLAVLKDFPLNLAHNT